MFNVNIQSKLSETGKRGGGGDGGKVMESVAGGGWFEVLWNR